MTSRARRALSAMAAVVLVALLVLALRRLDLHRTADALLHARPAWILATVLCFVAILPLWAAQWWLLSPAVPRRTLPKMLGVVAMTSSVLNTTPMLVGEATGVQLLSTVTGIDRGSGLAVLAMDQLLVGLAKLTVLAAAASVLPLPMPMREGARVLAFGMTLLVAGLLLVAWNASDITQWLATRVTPRVALVASRAALALAPLRSPGRIGGGFLLALAKKMCELLGILAVQHAFGVELAPNSALLVLAALNLATLLPLVPGNAGVFEAAVVLAYGWLGISAERALGMALVQHACYFVALALPGYAWLACGPARSAAAAP